MTMFLLFLTLILYVCISENFFNGVGGGGGQGSHKLWKSWKITKKKGPCMEKSWNSKSPEKSWNFVK